MIGPRSYEQFDDVDKHSPSTSPLRESEKQETHIISYDTEFSEAT
jgi:hypothetical protein